MPRQLVLMQLLIVIFLVGCGERSNEDSDNLVETPREETVSQTATPPLDQGLKTTSWDEFRGLDDVFCDDGCEEVRQIALGHGAKGQAGSVYIDRGYENEETRWADCIAQVMDCTAGVFDRFKECVNTSACPGDCKTTYLNRLGSSENPDVMVETFEAVFVAPGGYCTP